MKLRKRNVNTQDHLGTQTKRSRGKVGAGIALATAAAIAVPTGAFALWSVTVQDPGPTTIQTGEFNLDAGGWNWWVYDGTNSQWRKTAAGEGTFYGTYDTSGPTTPQMQGTEPLNLSAVGTALRVKLTVGVEMSNANTFEIGIFNDANGNDILDNGETKIFQTTASTNFERDYNAADVLPSWKAYAIPKSSSSLSFGSDTTYTTTISYKLTQLKPQA